MKIIEFLGLPRAGKSTQIERAREYLSEHGKRVVVLTDRERASSLATPPTEGLGYTVVFFSLVIEAYFTHKDSCDYLLVDRGICDVPVWADVRLHFKEITPTECEALKTVFAQYADKVDGVVYFSSSIQESLERHKGTHHEAVDAVAMNTAWLAALQQSYEKNKVTFGDFLEIDGIQPIEATHRTIIDYIQSI